MAETSLKITNIKCTTLLNLEKKGAIDPYVIIEYLGVSKKTENKDNDLNPEFGEVFDFDLSGKQIGPEDCLEVTVKDYEKIGRNRLLGSASIPIGSLLQEPTKEFSATLNDGQGRATTGKVAFSCEYVGGDAAGGGGGGSGGDDRAAAAGELGADVDPASLTMPDGSPIPEGPEGDAIRAQMVSEMKGKKRKPHGLPDKPMDFQVRVKVIKGRHLPGANINPTVRIRIGEEVKQTKVLKSTNKPHFDESFFFNYNERPNPFLDQMITFEVHNSKGMLSDSTLGSFACDLGLVYAEDGHAIINKWLLLTAPEEEDDDGGEEGGKKGASARPGGPPAGYLQVTAIVLGPGDEIPAKAKSGAKEEGGEDIESNLLRPAGVSLRPATFLVKIYRAEDLPQMDSAALDNIKRLFKKGPPKECCDPFFKFSFAGKTLKSDTKYSTANPEYNQELRVAFKFPSMCERLKLQFYDWDKIGNDDCIGTSTISLTAISGTGDEGFLPSFGPCFVNFYGSLREFSNLPDEYDDLNEGRGEGVAYRGRALVEIDTKFGDLSEKPVQAIMAQELVRVQSFLRRRKYKLFCSFGSASLIHESDGALEFEVSIGNYGNKLDNTVDPQSSSTPPTNPVFDGNAYYYLPWNETKPCCVVESHWEDIAFRLEPINILLKIIRTLEKNLKGVEISQRAKAKPAESAALLIALLDKLITDCKIPLPEFNISTNGVNELDLNMQDHRKDEMTKLVEEMIKLRESATDIADTIDVINGYKQRLIDLCIEPQNSMPDVIISMISGSKRNAYYRIPAYEIMFSENPLAKGEFCGRTQNIMMKYPGKKGKNMEKHPEIPAYVTVRVWLGLEKHQTDWTEGGDAEAEYSVYAETYENQIDVPIVDWTSKGCPRPAFSDSEGDVRLNKEDFQPPEGWQWDDGKSGEWFVDPELSANFDADAGHSKFTQDAFENESRNPGMNWGTSSIPYTNLQGDEIEHRDSTDAPDGWEWTSDWTVDVNRACDEEGWEYCVEASIGGWCSVMRSYHMCRRRRYVRNRELKSDPEKLRKLKAQESKTGEGWEYAPVFGMKYHQKERKLDMVRRRRWHRKMVNTIPGAQPTFSMPNDDDDKPPHMIMPRMFLAYDAPHKWQLRAYLFQARDILGLDSEGTSDAYLKVSFQTNSQNTRVIKETLCPEWDQTLVFEGVQLYGSPQSFAENPPYVICEAFDKDKVGKDEFLGRATIQPTVRLEGSKAPQTRLMWHNIMFGQRHCGDLLACFDLFLDEGADLPYPPPLKENRYIVPAGIRPVMVRTGVEVLCWGVRNMKKYQLANCTSPSASIEIGPAVITSDIIKNTKKNPNFIKNVYYQEVQLPKEALYMPPINIKIRDHRTFGRKPIVGRHVVKSIDLVEMPKDDPAKEAVVPADPAPGPSDTAITVEEPSPATSSSSSKKTKEEPPNSNLDWWSKYYASKGDIQKAGTYLDDGHKTMTIYPHPLEEEKAFNGFNDFVENFALERGKQDDEEDDNVVGEFKGLFRVYQLPSDPKDTPKARYFSKLPPSKPMECIVRVYVIRGIDLSPKDPNGKADPFLILELGKKKINNKDMYIPNELNPFFGSYFEMRAKIPLAKDLRIRVMDYDLIGANDLIGETTIDLENRFLTKCRATCGLPNTYYTSGPYQWRDSKKPKEILDKCARTKPQWLSETQVVVNGELCKLEDYEEKTTYDAHLGPADERLALYVLNNKDLGAKLVPEHIETRKLVNPLNPGQPQGDLELFVDILPLAEGAPGPPVNVTPRKAKLHYLRCIIWQTADVPPNETSILGDEMSDVFIKGWMGGLENKKEKTDVHYRCMDGNALFNWRLVVPFHYMPEEKVMVVEKKEHFWSLDTTKSLLPPMAVFQVWDSDMFSSNDFIGTLELNLNKLPRPKKDADKCTLEMLDDEMDVVDLFDAKSQRGWWIMLEEMEDGTREERGKVEMTLEIVTEEDAEARPAGQGREEPNANPVLDPPNRPETSFLWFTNPWKTLKHILWKKYKWVLLGILIGLILTAFIVIFLYSVPGYTVKKIFGV